MKSLVPMPRQSVHDLLAILETIPGGYVYSGVCSIQVCFPLRAGGELRISISDEDPEDAVHIDLYGGELPPGITGPATRTGNKEEAI